MPGSVATVVPTSTSAATTVFRPEIEVAGRRTVLLVDQMRAIDVDHVVGEQVDLLHHDDLVTVEAAVARYLGIV